MRQEAGRQEGGGANGRAEARRCREEEAGGGAGRGSAPPPPSHAAARETLAGLRKAAAGAGAVTNVNGKPTAGSAGLLNWGWGGRGDKHHKKGKRRGGAGGARAPRHAAATGGRARSQAWGAPTPVKKTRCRHNRACSGLR